MLTKTIFETKRIYAKDAHGKLYQSLKLHIYHVENGIKKEIYQKKIKLGVRDCQLSLPGQYDMMVTKNGNLKLKNCHENQDLVFKLDNQDIEFYGKSRCAGTIDIQSANSCNIIGELALDGGFRLRAKKFHLTNVKGKRGLLHAKSLNVQTQSFTNRGKISCSHKNVLTNKPASITTELFDNRGGHFEAGLADIHAKIALNNKGVIHVEKNLSVYLKETFTNGQGKVYSDEGNVDFHEEGNSKVLLTNGGEIKVPKGRLNCYVNEIRNNIGGYIGAQTGNFNRADKPSLGTVNHGTLYTQKGRIMRGNKYTNNGHDRNDTGILSLAVKNLELNSKVSKTGGMTCGDEIVTAALASFKYVDHALAAVNHCKLEFLYSQILNHALSMSGHINLISHHGKIVNHSCIESGLGIQVITPFAWGETYSIENHGQLKAKNSVVLLGKGVVNTADGIVSANKVITDCTHVNFTGRVDGAILEANGGDVYTNALKATKDITSRANHLIVDGYAKAGRNIGFKAQNKILISGLLEAGDTINLIAGQSIETSVNAQLKSKTARLESKEVSLNGKTDVEKKLEIKASDLVVVRGETFSANDISIQCKTFVPQANIKAKRIELDVNQIIAMKEEITADKISINSTVEMVYCEITSDGNKMFLKPIYSKLQQFTEEELAYQQEQLDALAKGKKKKGKMFLRIALGALLAAALTPAVASAICGVFSITNPVAVAAIEGATSAGIRSVVTRDDVPRSMVRGALSGGFRGLMNNVTADVPEPDREILLTGAQTTFQSALNGNPPERALLDGLSDSAAVAMVPSSQNSNSMLQAVSVQTARSFISNTVQAPITRSSFRDVRDRSAISAIESAATHAGRSVASRISSSGNQEEKGSNSHNKIRERLVESKQSIARANDEKKHHALPAPSSRSANIENELPPPSQRQYSNLSAGATRGLNNPHRQAEQSENALEFSRNPAMRRFFYEDNSQVVRSNPPSQDSFNIPNIDTTRNNSPHIGVDPHHLNHAGLEMTAHTAQHTSSIGRVIPLMQAGFDLFNSVQSRIEANRNASYGEPEASVCGVIGGIAQTSVTITGSAAVLKVATDAELTTVGTATHAIIPATVVGLVIASEIGNRAGNGAEHLCHQTVRAVETIEEDMMPRLRDGVSTLMPRYAGN